MSLDMAPERWLGALVQLNHLPHYGHRLNVIVLAHDLAEIPTERDREQAAGRSNRFVAPIDRFVKEDRVALQALINLALYLKWPPDTRSMSESKEHALTFSVLALFVLAIVLLVSMPGCKHEPLIPPIEENTEKAVANFHRSGSMLILIASTLNSISFPCWCPIAPYRGVTMPSPMRTACACTITATSCKRSIPSTHGAANSLR